MLYVFLLLLHIVEVLCGSRLVDGPTPLQDRVEAEILGQNQSICSLGFDSRAANVICSSLGYRGATQLWRYSKFGAGNMPLYSRLITCFGNESSLDMCNHSSIHIIGCDNSTVVGVECQGDAIKLETLFNSRPYEGVLVGFHGNMEYNFIGDISSGTAKHMCTLLGYGHVGFSTPTLPGTMLGLFKEHVACKGSETSVSECNDYILQGLRLGPDGILLMQIDSRHWAVYEDEFSPQTAEAACKIMGHKGFKTFRTELSGVHTT
ncbi:neurotrypsin-like isoform X2 [Dreissena polymorpha]|uniref:neurotrypsin-like isoform X2 n=1 Tax=Dreissena polymorpha TaxID=45954 RepID=UPI002264A356|nr:neurotrypsin-like isoform X2 [Dreissena polymorpha]